MMRVNDPTVVEEVTAAFQATNGGRRGPALSKDAVSTIRRLFARHALFLHEGVVV